MVKESLFRCQSNIIDLMSAVAKNPPEAVTTLLNACLLREQELDKIMRDKLLVCLMAREEGWAAAEKLERRIRGEDANPHVMKVMEEQAKIKEKEKKDKGRDRSSGSSARGKRPGPYPRLPMRQQAPVSLGYGGRDYPQQQFAAQQQFGGQQSYSGGASNYPRPFIDYGERTCHRCGKLGHFIRDCTAQIRPQ